MHSTVQAKDNTSAFGIAKPRHGKLKYSTGNWNVNTPWTSPKFTLIYLKESFQSRPQSSFWCSDERGIAFNLLSCVVRSIRCLKRFQGLCRSVHLIISLINCINFIVATLVLVVMRLLVVFVDMVGMRWRLTKENQKRRSKCRFCPSQ